MRPEDQVCDRDLAEKLRSLGVAQDSAFFWSGDQLFHTYSHIRIDEKNDVSAFTVAELGQMLPAEITLQDRQYDFGTRIRVFTEHAEWVVEYTWVDRSIHTSARFEADARAKMLVHLIENNLVTV
ncbi:hypothetical protein [Bradyrhizobium elkanii]|uniref:hypothetical protein n=1 Tax=Bradyrhizobium elkanii TaxID=29448 RepID=UPI003D21EAE0